MSSLAWDAAKKVVSRRATFHTPGGWAAHVGRSSAPLVSSASRQQTRLSNEAIGEYSSISLGVGVSAHSTTQSSLPQTGWSDAVKVFRLLVAFRRRGHLVAHLDPLRGPITRRLSPLEPISWRVGGRPVEESDVNQLLSNSPDGPDLSVFDLQDFRVDDHLPEGVNIPEVWGPSPPHGWTFRSFIGHLQRAYAGTLSIEHQHIESPETRHWLEERLEGRCALNSETSPSDDQRRQALWRLVRAHELECFLGAKYASVKRFGLEGCEVLLPCLWLLLEQAADQGMRHLLLGMAHRGRLNVLVNLLGKKVSDVCSEFSEQMTFLGDVKYHLGTSGQCQVGDHKVNLTLAPNPSHLEAVDPVVLGMTRARQRQLGDKDRRVCMPLLIHGDAAFSGQGVVAECMQLADLPAYTTGGTVHIVINNMVGFTTDPRRARSSFHCTNVAKINDAPVLHVNADDVDAVLFAASLAADYRQTFKKDFVIDLVCYRRHGHSELDDDSLTRPLTLRQIRSHPPVSELYGEALLKEGIVSLKELDDEVEQLHAEFEAEYHYAATHSPRAEDWRIKEWPNRPVNVTGLPEHRLTNIGRACLRIPEGFDAHASIKRIFRARERQLSEGLVDWSVAETLALASLMLKFDPLDHPLTTGFIQDANDADHYQEHPPCHVRLSGQDVERGTFNQRHSVIYDQSTAKPHNVMNDLGLGEQDTATICNSSLSELAILGFECGYSLEDNVSLTIWEAQFGDFANCAQVVIDNFIASGESKWNTHSSLVLSLPHGYEGQGPEHSSARLERFLQLLDDDPDDLWPQPCAQGQGTEGQPGAPLEEAIRAVEASLVAASDGATERAMRRMALLQESRDSLHNLGVVNVTTPANLFHVLRRQVHRKFAKPLALMSAKYLLHHRPCRSPLSHMGADTRFQRLIVQGGPGDNMSAPANSPTARRLIFCSGKVYYDLYHTRAARKLQASIALARLEQIAPFPSMDVVLCICRHTNAEILWVQEEPKNMGAWSYVAPRFATAMRQLSPDRQARAIRYIGRPSAANPATPLFKHHKAEVRGIIEQAMDLAT